MTTETALDELAAIFPGRVGLPSSALWNSARNVFTPEARTRQPAAAVRPRDAEEAAAVLRWAAESGTRVAVRSGGHSLDGFPVQEGVVLIDMRDLNAVDVSEPGRIRVMPAATVADVAKALAPLGHALPAGECPTVGMAGLTSGGGFGYAGRRFGLTLDSMIEASVALPDGRVHTVSADRNPDLYWACRGGAGCADRRGLAQSGLEICGQGTAGKHIDWAAGEPQGISQPYPLCQN